jgi:putative peptidoglycan lipid II flippase
VTAPPRGPEPEPPEASPPDALPGGPEPEPPEASPPDAARAARERAALTSRAGVVAAGTLVSRVLGLGRDLVLAGVFSRMATDAFMVAFTIPNVLRQLLAEGAVQNAVLPVLAKSQAEDGPDGARAFFRAARGLSLAILLSVSLLGVVFAPALVALFAEGFRKDPEQFDLTVTLTRWLFPYIFFMGTFAMGVAALNTHRRFVVTAFAPALLNVAFIACALTLPALLDAHGHPAILAMGAGALIGGFLQMVAQWPSLRRIGYLERPSLAFGHPRVREALRRMGPVLFGIGVYYIDVVIARRLLSDLPLGAQTYFGFALRLCDFPQGIFVMAIQTAALPSLAALAAGRDRVAVASTYAYGVRLTLFVAIPATLLFVVLAEPIVRAVFERGAFDATATRETARALVAQGLGIWTVAVVRQLLAVFFAVGDTRTPVVVASLDLVAFLVLALTLRGPLGHVGVGVAVAGSSAVQMVLLWIRARRHLVDLHLGEIARSAARTLTAAAPAALAALWLAQTLTGTRLPGGLATMLPGAAATVAFAALFLAASRLLRSAELLDVLAAVQRRRGR